jgi:hypothetical protein
MSGYSEAIHEKIWEGIELSGYEQEYVNCNAYLRDEQKLYDFWQELIYGEAYFMADRRGGKPIMEFQR